MAAQPSKLILASGSPRRRELLAEWGYDFEVIVPSPKAECGMCSGESPPQLVQRLARQKAADVAVKVERGIVLGCDTVAECRGQILGKPVSRDHARSMLELLRGREHYVLSGLCLWSRPENRVLVDVAITTLEMLPISDAEIDEYLDTGLWEGKAGGFGLQDRTGWIRVVEGSDSNVVGLPMELLAEMLPRVAAT